MRFLWLLGLIVAGQLQAAPVKKSKMGWQGFNDSFLFYLTADILAADIAEQKKRKAFDYLAEGHDLLNRLRAMQAKSNPAIDPERLSQLLSVIDPVAGSTTTKKL